MERYSIHNCFEMENLGEMFIVLNEFKWGFGKTVTRIDLIIMGETLSSFYFSAAIFQKP